MNLQLLEIHKPNKQNQVQFIVNYNILDKDRQVNYNEQLKNAMQATIKTIHERLMQANEIIIVPHPFPDGDALGSASALFEYLNRQNKPTYIYCPTDINPKLKFLPNLPPITIDEQIFHRPQTDVIIVVDSGDLKYAGIDHLVRNHPADIINIDHHTTNEYYGHHNLVLTEAASTTEIIYQYFNHLDEYISGHMATDLLTGIITDTGSFSNSATKPQTLSIAGELVRRGANYHAISFHAHKDKNLAMLKLWGLALTRLTTIEKLDLVYTYLQHQDFTTVGLSENDADGLANFMNNIDGPKITLILKELSDGKIKGSFRTTDHKIDVSAMAKQLGGGGHKKAAGFTLNGTIPTVIEQILTLNHK